MTDLIDPTTNRPFADSDFGGWQNRRSGERFVDGWRPSPVPLDVRMSGRRRTETGRSIDQYRNDGPLRAAISKHIDHIIGPQLKLSAQPNHQVLGLDSVWAQEFAEYIEPRWEAYANCLDRQCDASEKQTISEILRTGELQTLLHGEDIMIAQWLEDRPFKYATAIQQVSPLQLSNPNGRPNDAFLTDGVQVNQLGAPEVYYFQDSHPDDPHNTAMTWTAVPKRTSFGRENVIHDYEMTEPGQRRGRSIIAPILAKIRTYDDYHDLKLQGAAVEAMYLAVIESQHSNQSVGQAIGMGSGDGVLDLFEQQVAYHKENKIRLDGIRIPQLFPGEKLNFLTPKNAGPDYENFEKALQRYFSTSINQPYEMYSGNYADTNYSGARAGLLNFWKFATTRRHFIGANKARKIYALWLEEEFELGDVPLPRNAPTFQEARAAYSASRWIGPGKGLIDPEREAKFYAILLGMGLITYEDAYAELHGADWQRAFEQIAREKKRMAELGIQPSDLDTLALFSQSPQVE